MAERGWLRTAWVGPLTFLLHLAGVEPQRVGQLGDDAIYLGMGRSLARSGSLAVELLPGAPEIAKYPLGWPSLIAVVESLVGSSDPWLLLALNALLWALAAQLLVDGLLPKLGAAAGERAAVGLLVAVNTVSFLLVPTAMSEPLFALALVASLSLGLGEERRGRLLALVLTGALLGLSRSAGAPLLLVGVGLALFGRRPWLGLSLGAGWVLQALSGGFQRRGVEAADPILHYYTDYGLHTAWYSGPLREGELALLVGRVQEVVGANLHAGPRSLAAFVFPADFLGVPVEGAGMVLLGVGLFGLALVGTGLCRPARPLGVLLLAYAGLFLLWTWPFSSRFWLPIAPLVFSGAVLGLGRLGRVGRMLLWPLVVLVLLGNAPTPLYRGLALLEGSAELAEADLELEEGVDWLNGQVMEGDIVIADSAALWLAGRLDCQGIELRALLPAEELIGFAFGTPPQRALGEPLERLQALAGPEAKLWLVMMGEPGPGLSPLVAQALAEGRLEPQGRVGALEVWSVRR